MSDLAAQKRILFIPVSGPAGIGEYMRSLILADAISDRFPLVTIEFILSEQAPYISQCPYKVHATPASPTKSTAEVNAIIHQLKPSIVVFDCSGRAKQYQAAKRCGAKVIFISQHKKKRKRAFALNRIRHIDWHAIVQFEFVDGGINFIERTKLAIFKKNLPKFIGAVFSPSKAEGAPDISETFALFAAGGGGHAIEGKLATDIFWDTAKRWHAKTGQRCYVILGPNYPSEKLREGGVIPIKQLANAQLMYLLEHCSQAVIAGGDMMGQAVTLNVAVVAVPVAKDQPSRIKAFADERLVTRAKPDPDAMLTAMQNAHRPSKSPFVNGAESFIEKVASWL